MIINMPSTTTREINSRLLKERDEGGAIALGRVLNLIIDADDTDPEVAIEAAREASLEHPCRVIVLTKDDDVSGDDLHAQIRLGGDAGASEVIILRTSGQLDDHLDTLVLPLLLPDTPVVAWWPNQAPTNPSRHSIGQLAQRRITDSTNCSRPVVTLSHLGRHYQPGDTDLAWSRATRWRGLLAAALDQPPYGPVKRVQVRGQGDHPSMDLLAAWLGLALNCPVTVNREDHDIAITEVALERESGPIVVSRPDGQVSTLSQPGQPSHQIPLPLRNLRECLAEELRRLDPDEVYGEVIQDGLIRLEETQ